MVPIISPADRESYYDEDHQKGNSPGGRDAYYMMILPSSSSGIAPAEWMEEGTALELRRKKEAN